MRGYISTRWGQLHYSRRGQGQQTFVLFHETPLRHDAFRRLIPLLEDDFQVVAFDTPGYGQSAPPPTLTTMEEYAATIAEGIDALGLDRMILFGVHTGASIAYAIASQLQERVDGLVVSGLPFYEDDVREARRVPPVPPVDDDGGHLLSVFHWEPDVYDAELRSRLVSGVYEHPDHAYAAFHAVYLFQPTKYLDQLTCPVLALSHAKDPVFSGDGRLVREIPRTRQIVVEADRLPLYWTQPAEIGGYLREFAAASGA
ncbi:alpha/beta fold hydrolase [Rhodococcus koreensis]